MMAVKNHNHKKHYLWRVGSDIIEDIDEDEEEGYEKRHSA